MHVGHWSMCVFSVYIRQLNLTYVLSVQKHKIKIKTTNNITTEETSPFPTLQTPTVKG